MLQERRSYNTHLLPMSVSHSRVAQSLYQWDIWLEVLYVSFDFLRHVRHTYKQQSDTDRCWMLTDTN